MTILTDMEFFFFLASYFFLKLSSPIDQKCFTWKHSFMVIQLKLECFKQKSVTVLNLNYAMSSRQKLTLWLPPL